MKRRQFIKGSAILGASIAANKLVGNSGMFSHKTNRKIYKILNADRTKVGTLPILRAFAGDHLDHVSPFVLFDEFGPVDMAAEMDPLRVDAHPHAGVIPTTYFLSGSGHHKDSLDYDFQINKGEFMLFSSGKGAIHMEETGQKMYDEGGAYHGFQIWLNMPAAHKFSNPTTAVHGDTDMGTLDNEQFWAKVVLGELFEAKSKVELLSPAFYYHIKLKSNGKIEIPVDGTHNAFVYMISGEAEIEDKKALQANQIALTQRGGESINLFSAEGAEMLVLGGAPMNEPIFTYGPFVMNTEAQIRQVIRDYQMGKMGNPDLVNAK